LRIAFDSVPHKPLIDKLEQTGMSTHILNWVTEYLTDREQKVMINGVCTSSEPVLSVLYMYVTVPPVQRYIGL